MAKLLILMLSLAIGACSLPGKTVTPLSPQSGSYRAHDVEITWSAKMAAGAVRIEGTVKNLRIYLLRDFELEVRLLDEAGNVIAKGSTPSAPNMVDAGESVPYSVVLRPKGDEVKQAEFTYTYFLAQSPPAIGSTDETVPRTSSFRTPLHLNHSDL